MIDSGAGGLTILNAIHKKQPYLDLLYLADEAFAPYGSKEVGQLQDRLIKIGHFFESEKVSAIVVACNTATVAAIDALRATTSLPVIGVEPAVKPAFRISKQRKVAVLATPVTACSVRLNQLIELWKADAQVSVMSSDTLAFDIDAWPETRDKIEHTIHQLSAEMLEKQVDTLVLACTHYPLVKSMFEKELGMECEIIEPSEGVTAQLARRLFHHYLDEMNALTLSKRAGGIELCSTLDVSRIERLANWVAEPSRIISKKSVKI